MDIIKRENTLFNIIFQIIILFVAVSLFCERYDKFFYFISIALMPVFASMSLFYFIKTKHQYIKLTSAIVLCVLLAGEIFYLKAEINKHKHRFTNITINTPLNFQTQEAQRLYSQGIALSKAGNCNQAIVFFEQALEIEPNNTDIILNLTDCYANFDLERAIDLLNEAIILNDSYAPFYNNRGLYYYKMAENDKALQNFEKAIELDTEQSVYELMPIYYINSALAYYYKNEDDNACKALKMAESFGFDYNAVNNKFINKVKRKVCK